MLSHKHDNITITFKASTGHQAQITVGHYTTISKVLKLYREKFLMEKVKIREDIMFISNGKKLDIHDNRTIEEISEGFDSILISVYDVNNIIGA